MIITMLGKRWRLRFTPLGADHGQCDGPDKRAKEIRVDIKLDGEKRLEILIHELTHAAFWWLDEQYVAEFSRDLARILHKLGYQCDK